MPYERYPLWWVVGENALLMIYVVVSTILLWPLKIANLPIVALIYLLSLITTFLISITRGSCVGCAYFDRLCHCGWGRLTVRLAGQPIVRPTFENRTALLWISATYLPYFGLLTVLLYPSYLGLFLIFLLLSALNTAVHLLACSRCLMQEACWR